MPIFPIRLKTPIGVRYLDWSTIVDGPRSAGRTWPELVAYMRQDNRGPGERHWKARVARMKRDGLGTLDRGYTSVDSVISANRCGADGTSMSLDQIIDYYCVRRCVGERPRGMFGLVEEPSNQRRVVIVFDGRAWFVRRLSSLVHDLDRNEKIYTCDQPIGGQFATPGDAMAAATAWLDSNLEAAQ